MTERKSIGSELDGQPWEHVLAFIQKFAPAVGQYLLTDGSWVERASVDGKACVKFRNHGIYQEQKARDFRS